MSRVPLELQSAINECGLACLSMVAGYCLRQAASGTTDLAALRRRFGGFGQGLTLKQLVSYAHLLGLDSRGLKCEPPDLVQVRTPAILHWRMDHFVVLVKVKKRGCLIHDPARGRVFVSWSELDHCFTGVVLEVWPGNTPQKTMFLSTIMRVKDFLPMLRGLGQQLFWLLALSVLLQVMVLLGPWHVQWTVDEALLTGDTHLLGVLALGFVLLLLCRVMTATLRGLLIAHLGHALSFRLAYALLQHLLHLPLQWYEQHHIGDVVSRFGSLAPIRELLTQGAAAALVDLIIVLLSLGLMFIYSPGLATLVLVVHLFFALAQLGWVPMLRRYTLGVVVAQAAEQTHLLASIRAVRSVKVYAQEPRRLAQWQTLHAHVLGQSIGLQRAQIGMGALAQLVGGGELVVVVYLAAHSVLEGVFSVGMLFAFLSYRGHFAERLRGLVEQLVQLRSLQTHLQRLSDIWLEPQESLPVQAPSNTGTSVPPPADLHLQDVGIRWRDREPWLVRHVNLSIPAGEYVAIVGPSGGGKTSLLKLMMGLAVPTEGQILSGDLPLQDAVLADLRSRSGCVLQGDDFFSGSVLENVTLFDEAVDVARLQNCLGEVGMAEVLKRMPMGLHTPLGDMASGFSCGQLQRLMLARALYRMPDYLFLDEGTANLDADSARMVQSVVERLTCTRVVITHDLSFASGADRVYLLENGCLRKAQLAPRSAVTLSPG